VNSFGAINTLTQCFHFNWLEQPWLRQDMIVWYDCGIWRLPKRHIRLLAIAPVLRTCLHFSAAIITCSSTVNVQQEVLASGGRDRTVRLWDLRACEQVAARVRHEQLVWNVLLRGHTLITGSFDETVKVLLVQLLDSSFSCGIYVKWTSSLRCTDIQVKSVL